MHINTFSGQPAYVGFGHIKFGTLTCCPPRTALYVVISLSGDRLHRNATPRELESDRGTVAARKQIYSDFYVCLSGAAPENAHRMQQQSGPGGAAFVCDTSHSCSALPRPAQPHLQVLDLSSGRIWAYVVRSLPYCLCLC